MGSGCALDFQRELPETITAGGVTRWLTRHLRETPRDEITVARIQYALEHWVVRGVCRDGAGRREAMNYWGLVPGREDLLRVVVSLDNQEIVTVHFDKFAAERVEDEGRPWFQRRCRDLEVRDAG